MDENAPQIQRAIQQNAAQSQFSVYDTNAHRHNGVDGLRVDIADIARFPSNATQGDILYYGANEWLTLHAGTSGYFLETVGGTTVQWASVKDYGDGSDGAVTIGTTTTLTRDMFYSTLTVNGSTTLYPNGFKIFSNMSITVKGTISVDGGTGGTGGNGSSGSGSTGGSGGSAGTGIASGSLKQPGNGTVGGLGGTASTGGSGANGSNETNCIQANNGANGGAGGTGGFTGGGGTSTGGTATQTTKASSLFVVQNLVNGQGGIGCNPNSAGGSGGGSGTNNNGAGGGGGGSGASGGIIWMCSPSITISSSGILTVKGGNGGGGGNGGNGAAGEAGGGGGGGGGGNGGFVLILAKSYSNSGSVIVTGGSGGNGGSAGSGGGGANGTGGSNGSAGTLVYYAY